MLTAYQAGWVARPARRAVEGYVGENFVIPMFYIQIWSNLLQIVDKWYKMMTVYSNTRSIKYFLYNFILIDKFRHF